MLKKVKVGRPNRQGGHFAIVASSYNARYVDAMLRAAQKTLRAAQAESVRVVRVPGAYEIPVVTARLARTHMPPLSAILCLGVILRGATTHAEHIGRTVTDLLGGLAMATRVPVIHEVLLLENETQAVERCLDSKRNRGIEAARTAVVMGQVMRDLRSPSPAE